MAVHWLLAAAAAGSFGLAACTGQISDPHAHAMDTASPPSSTPDGTPNPQTPTAANGGGDPGQSPSAPADSASNDQSDSTGPACTGPAAAPAPLSRLTDLEYRNTLHALLPMLTLPDIELPPDNVVEGFDNNAKAQTPSTSLIEQYRANAQAIGAVAANTDNVEAVVGCNPTTSAEQDACAAKWIDRFIPKAYRRPITSDERDRYNAFFAQAKSDYGFETAVNMTVQAALQSPHFLYRIELGGPANDGVAKLTGYELASRLSYFLWDSMPDDELTDAASSGTLDTADGVEAQARRMLDDPKAHDAVDNFMHQWLRFDKMDTMPKSPSAYPDWNDQVAQSLRTSASKFVDRVFWDLGGSLRALLTDTSTYVDANIAPIYGVDTSSATKPGASGMALVDTDKSQRSGILTQAGLMAAFAHETADSPVLRGVFVMDRLLCSAPPPPPPGVTGSITDSGTTAMPQTTRDRFAMTHESGTCAACHHMIDGFGFGFEHYDAVGQWRTTENGVPVDAKGWVTGTSDADGEFDGAVELGQRLADSTQVSDCVASQFYRYALGLGAADVQTCDIAPVRKAFTQSGGDMRELMIATVTSDAFRARPEVTP